MICIETQYLSLNKFLLLSVGLWPYKRTRLVQLQSIFFLCILTSAILFQFTTFLTSRCTPDFVIKVLSVVCFFTTFVIKYISFATNTEVIKDLLMQLQYVCDELKNENEEAIIKKYGYNAKCFTTGLTICGICSVSAILTVQNWMGILDIVLPINASRPLRLMIMVEYFIDEKKYFYFILLHIYAAICIGTIVIVAIGTTLISYLQFTYAMFKISCYRIECAMRTNLHNFNVKNENLIFEGMICAIKIHREAMRLSLLLVSKFETMLFGLIMVGVLCLSLNLFRILSFGNNVHEIILPFIFIVVSILYMFIANYVGQDAIDHTNDVYVTAYNVEWYVTPLYIQKMILFLLQRGAKDFTLGVTGLFVGSLECFATLVKASVSYFTVMYSTR